MLSLYIHTKSNGWLQAFLEPDASISVEINSPVFDLEAGGGFSYPFNLPVEPNQHLFPTVTNHHGAKIYDLIYHRPFRLECDNYPILYGIIDLDEEVEAEEQDNGTHAIAINLASNNLELTKLLDGVNAQDVPLKDRIPVGVEFHSLEGYVVALDNPLRQDPSDPTLPRISISLPLPKQVFSLNKYKATLDGQGEWVNPTNVAEPYPNKPYCNVAVSIQKREKQGDGNYVTLREYETFDADRQNSGVCFYIQYFLDCLFAHAQIAWDNSQLAAFDDFNRLAFFTTKCECDVVPAAYDFEEEIYPLKVDAKKEFSSLFEMVDLYDKVLFRSPYVYYTNLKALAYNKYANSKNFPDTEANSILTELQNAFGVRFIYDSDGKRCKAIYVKDIFAQNRSIKSAAIIHDVYHEDQNLKGVKMTYGGGDDDTSYNYDPAKDNSKVIIRNGYGTIRNEKGAYDKNTYYDTHTANMYRIKVDEDAKTEEELYPSLFEVGQFQDASVGDTTDEDMAKEISIGFSPVVSNIVEYVENQDGVKTTGLTSRTSARGRSGRVTNQSCKYAVFLDLELSEPTTQKLVQSPVSGRASGDPRTGGAEERKFTGYQCIMEYTARYGYTEESVERYNKYKKFQSLQRIRTGQSQPLLRYEEDPLSTYDAGFSLGVMRGPGNDAGVDVVQENYDGNGNARWAYTPTNYAFTSDSIDHFGKWFDYNGEGQGGIDPEQRFSLKLMAEKVQHFQGKRVDGDSVLITTPEEAAYWMSYLFPTSHQDVFSFWMNKNSEIQAKGWSVTGMGNYIPVYPVIRPDVHGTPMMLNAVKTNGDIFTPAELTEYALNTNTKTGNFWDNENVYIKDNATQKDVNDLIALANIYYFPEQARPYTLTGVPATATTSLYPVNASVAHRGLLHKFNYEYFWFLIHARRVTLDTTMTIQELRHLSLLDWNTFGEYTGLIEKIQYSIHNQTGLSHVTITLKYL